MKQYLGLIGRQRDELVELTEKLKEQVIRDHLSGLFNRRYFEETMEHEVHWAAMKKIPIGLIMLDIDCFKSFNDAAGHIAGDKLLQTMGTFLCEHVQITDIVCRYGGDEFVIVLPGSSRELTEKLTQRLQAAVKALQVEHNGIMLGPISISQGAAVFPDHGATRDAVVLSADTALYRAKHEGRDRAVLAGSGSRDEYLS